MNLYILSIIALNIIHISNTTALPTDSKHSAQIELPLWNKDIINLAETMPIQSEGRIKPLSTHARFLLLQLSGRFSIKNTDGKNMSPTEWFLTCLFYPNIAQHLPTFIVHDQAVLENLGLKPHEKKRDRYSYKELVSARDELMKQAQHYSQISPNQRTRIQEQIINLAENLLSFEETLGYLEFTRFQYPIPDNSLFSQILTGKKEVHLLEIITAFPEIKRKLKEISSTLSQEQSQEILSQLRNLLSEISQLAREAEHFTVIPPEDPAKKEWISPLDTVINIFDPSIENIPDTSLFSLFIQLEQAKHSPHSVKQTLAQLIQKIHQTANNRGEAKKINIEVLYYKGKFLFYSQWIFFFAVVITAIWWLVPDNKYLKLSVFSINALAFLLLISAILLRCIIRGRPPVTTLYETILFSTATAVLLAFLIERFTHDNIPLSLASFLGLIGLFLANRYEMKEATDTMPSLVAVLDTNFWLTIHVTTIVIGYGAGFVASAFAHIWIISRLLKLKTHDLNFYNRLTKGIYGTICFCFFFSFIGTVLGGIWALQSWGRFWGWDPKENGALLIVLWCLVIIHAHLGHIISEFGKVISALILGIVVSFSWWGVNLLGVGLHSYGFTQGVWKSLLTFWIIETVFILAGVYIYFSKSYAHLNTT